MKRKSIIPLIVVLLSGLITSATAGEPKKITDLLGLTYGFEYSNFKAWPRDPNTGNALTLTNAPDLRQKDDLAYKANFFNLTLNAYGSLIGAYMASKTKSRVIVGDYSELGIGMGFARVMNIYSDLKKDYGNTVGLSVNMGTGLIAGYRITDDIFASVRYQWIIEQYFSPYENHVLNAIHRKRLTFSGTWNGFALAVNVCTPWALKEDKTMNIVWQNKGAGVELKCRMSEKSIIGVDYNATKIRFKDLDNEPVPYWDRTFSSIGLFFGLAF